MISEPSKNLSRIRLFSRKTKRKSLLFLRHLVVVFLIWLIGGFPTLVYALPEDGQIVSGSGTITEPTATSMQIDQFTGEMIINWNSFNIGGSESVNFTQPSSSAIALNRVIGTDPSLLLGNLTANGQVFIVNGSGVFFGPGSKIDTHGLIATTMGISDQDFLDQNYNFSQDIDNPLTSVINEGTISTTSYVGLLAPAVANRGTIVASLGSVDLAAGKAATLDFTGDGLISFEVTEAVSGTVTDKDGNVLQDRVSNSGLIQADGGQVRMTAKDAGDVIRHVVNMEGTIQANTVVEKEGRVFLTGGSSGVVNVSGTITASGDDVGEEGGTVHVLGEMVGLFDNAVVNVSGDAGGGEVLIGGDFQGKNAEVQNAFRTYVGEDAVIDASAGTSGDGGKVIVWADDVTRFYGSVLATGGSLSGDGGFVEVSGKGTLNFHALQIALGAVNGVDGVLLLDPLNITISSSADSNTAGFTAGSDDTEAFAEDSGLTSNFDVTASSGSFNGVTGTIELQATNDITVSAAWNIATSTGNSNVSVVLRAGNDINIDQAITLDGTGTLTIEADGNTANGAGDLVFGASGSFTTGGGNIDITANDIDLTSGSINAGAGTVTLLVSDGGAIALGASGVGMVISGTELQNITATNLTIGDATNGDITVEGITGANTINITGLTTLNANNTGASINFSSTASIFTNALTLNANFGVTMNVSLTVGGAIVLDSDSDNNGAGDFSVADGQTVNSSNNSLTITANDINLNTSGALNTGSGDITILVSDGGTIGVGAASGDMQITDAELGNITANNLTIGDSTGGNISISTVTAANTNTISGTITLDASGSGKLISTDNSTSVFENALTLTANTSITVAGDLSTNQGDLNFNGAMIIGEANTPTVSTGAGAGDITVTGAITGTTGGSAETLILLAGTGAVTLAAVGAGDTTGLVNFTISSSGSATFGGAVNLPTPGVLAVTSTGDITGTAASITVVATSSFTTSGTGTITLTNASNVFTGGITLSSGTGAVQLTDSSATILATSTLGGNLTVTSSGAITQAGSLTVSGTSSFTSTGGDITLTDGSNDLGANLTLDVNNSFNVVTTSTLTDLTLTVSSSSSSTYALSASNISAFNLSDTGSNIQIGTLTATALNFGLTVDTDTVTTSGAMSVGTGSLSVTTSEPSGNGSITISNTLAAGSLTLDANGQQSDVNINNVVTIASGGAVTLTADDAINFSSSGSITASGAGNISLQSNTDALAGGSDAIAMTDGSTIDAGSGTLTLTSTGANSGDITVGELTTTNSTASAVTVTADAAIVDGGDTDVDIVATSGTINLIGATSIGSGDAIETNTAVLVLDSNGGIEIANTTTTLTDLTMTIDPASNPTYALSSTGLTTFSLAASGGDITTFVVDSSTALNFSLNTDTGSITTSGAMDVGTGSFSLTNNDTGTGSAINFSNTLAAGSLILDANGQFSDINISAALAITSAGAVTLTADDAVNINSGGSITASGAGNVSITANDVTTDGNSFDVIQMSSGTSIDAGSGTITLSAVGTNATNNTLRQLTTTNSSSTALVINALGNVAFNDTVNVTGDISVTSSGNISQTAALTIGGASSFDTSASTGTITLTNTSNDFTGAVTLASGTGAVQIFDSATLILATSTTLGGNLTASADNGLTISGDLTSTGNMTLEGDANNSSDGTDNISITSGVTLNSGGTLTMDATTGGITAVGSAVFTATSGITINDTLSVSTGTVTFNNAASIAGLSLTAGTIDGAGDITVTGAMTWSGGTISGTRTLTTDTGVTTTMSASSAATLDTNVTWENDGTIDWNFSSSDFAIDGTLNNKSGADFNLQHTTNNADITGSGTVNNLSGATMTLNAAATDTDFAPTFNNTGTVTVTQGDLQLNGDGTDTGTYTVASGETLSFFNASGTRDLQSGSSISGAGNVNLGGTGTRTIAGTYSVTGTTTLSSGTNTFSSSGTIGMDTLTVSGGTNTFSSSSLSATGTFTLSGAGTISTSGTDLSISAVDFDLTSTAISAGAGKVTITQSAGGTIGLGATAGAMTISDTELDLISATNVQIGDGTVGSITVDGISNTSVTGTLTLITGGTLGFNTTASSITNALTFVAGNDVTQTVALTVGGNASFTTSNGSIQLNNASNDLGTNLTISVTSLIDVVTTSTLTDLDITLDPAIASGTYSIVDSGNLTFTVTDAGTDLTLTEISVSSGNLNLSLTTATGAINLGDTPGISVGAGNVTLVSTSGAIEEINNNTNTNITTTGTVSMTGLGGIGTNSAIDISGSNNLIVDADQGIQVASATTLTDLTVTVDPGSTTDTYSITDGGNLTFAMTDSGTDITLTTMSVSSGSINFNLTTDTGDITLGTIDTGTSGNLGVTATSGAITQSSSATVGGTSSFTVTGTNVATLTNASNDFIGAVTLASGTGAVQLVDTTATSLAASTLGGTLVVTSGGAITQTGDLSVTGAATFITTTDGSNIILDSSGNAFSSQVSLLADTAGNETFGNITFVDSAEISLDASATGDGDLFIDASTDGAVGGILNLTATTGDITQNIALAVTGTSSFTVSNTNAITLTNTSNDFTSTVTLSSGTGAVQLTDSTDTILAASTLGGNLTVLSSGAITQTGALSVTGTSDFTVSGSNAMTLTQANVFTGAVTLSSGTGAAQITDSGTLILAASTLGGDLTASADNGLTINGDLTTTGDMTLEGDANNSSDGTDTISLASAITLDSGGNMTLDATTSGISATGSATLKAKGDLNINNDFISLGRLTLTADSDASGVGDFKLASGATITTNNNDLDLAGANIDISSGTADAGSGAATFSITQSITADGTNLANLTAGSLEINVAGDFIVDGVTSSELTNVSGLLTLKSTGDITFQNNASSHDGAVTVLADDDINVKVDVTSDGDFTATADNDDDDIGDFILDTGATVTSSNGNIDITAVSITENGTLDASGTITRTEATSTASTEEAEDVDQGTSSTFVQDFTSPAESGC